METAASHRIDDVETCLVSTTPAPISSDVWHWSECTPGFRYPSAVPQIRFPSFYDLVMVPADWAGIRRHRRALVTGAAGRTLEIASGTGLNLRHYRRVDSLVIIDPSLGMLAESTRRTRHCPTAVILTAADGMALPFADRVFDTVVLTLSLCTIPDPRATLREVERVLAPEGELRFLEHIRHRRAWVARIQSLLTPHWRRISGGCHLDRSTRTSIEEEGFEITWSDTAAAGWLLLGVARVNPRLSGAHP